MTVSRSKKPRSGTQSTVVFTIGHSTHAIDEFVSLLRAHGVSWVVDVRTVPRSRHNPQFNQDSLPDSLKKAGLRYVHMPGLGGLRHAKAGSITNAGWRKMPPFAVTRITCRRRNLNRALKS
jgi:hypothetical protein